MQRAILENILSNILLELGMISRYILSCIRPGADFGTLDQQ